MPIEVNGLPADGMKEAAKRLKISRDTLKRNIANGFFTEPKWIRRGVKQKVRYFDEAWYKVNEKRLRDKTGKD